MVDGVIMRIRHLLLPVLTGSLVFAAVACSDDSDSGNSGNPGTGGAATGGTTNTTGGTANTGGTSNTGGTGGSGSGKYISATDAGLTVGTGAYDYADMGGSTVTLTNPEPGKICGAGTAAQILDAKYDMYWGAGIAVQLADPGSFDASGYDGISFTISGVPAEIRVGVTLAADTNNSFFSTAVTEGDNTLLWDDLAQGSWVTDICSPTESCVEFDATTLKDLQFQVPAIVEAPVTFDFCISNIKFVGDGGGMGGAGGEGGL